MATNNAINTGKPIEVIHGGTSVDELTDNGVLYGDGTDDIGVTAEGDVDTALTSHGGVSAPTFEPISPGGSGGMTFLASDEASASASLIFNLSAFSTYRIYFIAFSNIVPVSNGVRFSVDLSNNAGASYASSNYRSSVRYNNTNSVTSNTTFSNSTILLSNTIGNTAGIGVSGYIWMYEINNTSSSAGFVRYHGQSIHVPSSGTQYVLGVLGGDISDDSGYFGVNTLRFDMTSGNISTGKIVIYGVSEV